MKFGLQFEFHKIPEWYCEYLDYAKFKAMISSFKRRLKAKEVTKLRGLYYLTSKKYVIQMDIASKLKGSNNLKKNGSDYEEDNGNQLVFETREGYKDDSCLIPRQQYFDQEDFLEQRMVEQEIAHLINGDAVEPRTLPVLTYKRSKSIRKDIENQLISPLGFAVHKSLDEDDLKVIKFDLPKIDKHMIQTLQVDSFEDDFMREMAEQDMRVWVDEFLEEINKIEHFFNTKFQEYCEEFDILKKSFIKRNNRDKKPIKQQISFNNSSSQYLQSENFNQSQQINSEIQLANLGSNETQTQRSNQLTIGQSTLAETNKDLPSKSKFKKGINENLFQTSMDGGKLATGNRLSLPVNPPTIKLKPSITVDIQRLSKVKDEMQYATNWRRSFTDLYAHLKWLNAYAKINYIAAFKIQKKFMKTYFFIKDNVLDKKLTQLINLQEFANKKIVSAKVAELIEFYAQSFTKNDLHEAEKLLENQQQQVRSSDKMLISFFCGSISIIVFMFVMLMLIPDSALDKQVGTAVELFSSFHTFRLLFMLIFTLCSAGVVMKILGSYKINFMYIFELDPQYKITYIQFFRLAIMLFQMWAFCLMCQAFVIKFEFLFHKAVAAFTLGVLGLFLIICLQPFHCVFRKGRLALVKTLWNIVISPFGIVRFRHFFFADILCSFSLPLKDLGYTGCFFFQGGWLNSTAPTLDTCPRLENYFLAIAFLPYWFRLAQCFRRYHDCKLKIHLANAGKYFSVILIQFANIFKTKIQGDMTLYLFIFMALLSTLYCYAWDLYMDWGLLRSKDEGRKFLRPKTLFSPWFYYYAIFSNLILRFIWTLALIGSLPQWMHSTQFLITLLTIAEGFRRAQWCIIRLENEQLNNFEKYRTFLEIPAVKEESDGEQNWRQ